jgi:uncharacterized protein (UPF0303 family)
MTSSDSGDSAEAVEDSGNSSELLLALMREERELVFSHFDQLDAWQVGSALVEHAISASLPVAVSIDFAKQRVFHAALPGASRDNDLWLRRKARVVRMYGQSSLRVGTYFRSLGGNFAEHSLHDPKRFAATGGAFPLRIGASMIGVIAVSGLTESQDHDLVVHALRTALSRLSS